MRLFHFADTHIGVETYGRIDPATGRSTRLDDFAQALGKAVDFACEREVDAALFAGDAYRGCDPNPTHQQVFAAAIQRLVEAEIPVVMITGNHDLPVAYGRATALEIFRTLSGDRVTVITQPELVVIQTKSGALQVAGLPWPRRSVLRASEQGEEMSDQELHVWLQQRLEQTLRELAEQSEPSVPTVLLAHLAASEAVYSGSEQYALSGADPTLATTILAHPKFDYVALGHLHRHQSLHHGERPPVVYPGSLERLDFGEAKDDKGVCFVTIESGPTAAERATTWEFARLGARPMVPIKLKLPPEADATATMVEAIGRETVRDAIVRVTYTCSDEQAESIDWKAVRLALSEAHLVAGLIREHQPDELRPEVRVSDDLGVAEALELYLDSKPDLAALREPILTTGLALDAELTERDAAAGEGDV